MGKFINYLVCIATFFAMISSCGGTDNKASNNEPVKFYVGSSDRGLEHSIFLCELNPESGEFAVLDSFAGATGPSYLAFSPGKEFLYTINAEISDAASGHRSVSSFKVDSESYSLSFLNSQSSEGAGPCHVSCSNDGDHIFIANYNSGHSTAFPIADDGSIVKASSVVMGSGNGPVESRQKGPHAHMASLDPENNFLLVPDLGSDRILVYAFDKKQGKLTPNPEQAYLQMEAGSGPRHLVFHPGGKFVYVVSELNSTVTACSYDGEKGRLTALHTVSTVSESHEGSKYPAAIRIDREGSFLYASTRGEHSKISTFKVEEDGRIYRIQEVEVTNWPRDFNIVTSGNFLLAAGEKSGVIELYHIDRETGKLDQANSELLLPAPGCILFLD